MEYDAETVFLMCSHENCGRVAHVLCLYKLEIDVTINEQGQLVFFC